MKIDIGNFHTEEQVGTIDDKGNLETDSTALKAVAEEFVEEGVYAYYPFHADGEDGGEDIVYREFNIKPGTKGFLREFVDILPSPYDCDMEKLDELPTFDPDEYMQKRMEKDDFPTECRSCGENRRMSGSFVCPSCHPDKDEDEYDGDLAGGNTKEKMVDGAVRALSKDWVSDPTEEAPNRWTNTETGEHRYQENKPAPSEVGESETDDSPTLDIDEAEEVVEMADYIDREIHDTGTSMETMSVAEMSDGTHAFVTEITSEEDDKLAKQSVAAGSVLDGLGVRSPEHHYEEGEYISVEGIDGVTASVADEEDWENVDREDVFKACASQILVGNPDAHLGNFVLADDGDFVPIDMEHAGRAYDTSYEDTKRGSLEAICESTVDTLRSTPIYREEDDWESMVDEVADAAIEMMEGIHPRELGEDIEDEDVREAVHTNGVTITEASE